MELEERVAKALAAATEVLAPPLSALHGCDGDAAVAKAVWTRAFINSLPDASFLYIEPGGKKDDEGKTTPRTLRHFPVRDADGELDLPHLRNALSRIPQSSLPDSVKARVQAEAEHLLASVQKVDDVVTTDLSLLAAASLVPNKLSYREASVDRIRELTDVDLHNYDVGAHTVFREQFGGTGDNAVGDLTREVLVSTHALIVQEFMRRGLPHVRQALPAGITGDDALDLMTVPVLAGMAPAQVIDDSTGAVASAAALDTALATASALVNVLQQEVPYALIWQRWERPVIIRGVSTQEAFHLLVRRGDDTVEDFQFPQDPLAMEKMAVARRELKNVGADALMSFQGTAGPGVEVAGVILNPTKSTSSEMVLLSGGKIGFAVDEPLFKQAEIRSGSLADGLPDGRFTLTADPHDTSVWFFERGGRAVTAPQAAAQEMKIQKLSLRPWTEEVRLFKADDVEEHFVLGVVLEPGVVDAQNDTYTAEEVRKAAHFFMENFAHIGLMHKELIDDRVKILESYVAPTDFTLGTQVIRAGTWLLGARILDPALWADIKAGKITGWSIGGSAIREPAAAAKVANACFAWAA